MIRQIAADTRTSAHVLRTLDRTALNAPSDSLTYARTEDIDELDEY